MSEVKIKKQFSEVHDFLVANKDKKVKTVLDQLTEMMSAQRSRTETIYVKNAEGEVIAGRCHYFKRWFLIGEVDDTNVRAFAMKNDKLSNLSKNGSTLNSRQLNQWRNGKAALPDAMLAKMKEDPDFAAKAGQWMADETAKLEAQKNYLPPCEDGWTTKAAMIADLLEAGYEFDHLVIDSAKEQAEEEQKAYDELRAASAPLDQIEESE